MFCTPCMHEFKSGLLHNFEFKQVATLSPKVLRLLLAGNTKPLTAKCLQNLFEPDYEKQGSSKKINWCVFLQVSVYL